MRTAFRSLILVGCLLGAGCGQTPSVTPPPVTPSQSEPEPPPPAGPSRVELSEPQATLDEEGVLRFQVRYRFVQGKPSKFYLCEIAFPGTPNHGAKPMERWELKTEGVIRDGIPLKKGPVKEFEIRFSEAESPQLGYHLISNVVRGTVKE